MSQTMNLNQEQVERVKGLRERSKREDTRTITEYLTHVFNIGLSTLEQRQDSYGKTSERNKKARKALKFVESKTELMIEAGFARKSDGNSGIQQVKS